MLRDRRALRMPSAEVGVMHGCEQDEPMQSVPIREPLTLETLPAAYEYARAVASANAVYREAPDDNTCRYCGKHRQIMQNTRLDGHAVCVVTREFIAAVDALYRSDPKLNRPAIAEALSVSHMTVTAWTTNRQKRKR